MRPRQRAVPPTPGTQQHEAGTARPRRKKEHLGRADRAAKAPPFVAAPFWQLPLPRSGTSLLPKRGCERNAPRDQALGLRPPAPAPAAPPPSSRPCSAAWTRGSPAGGGGGAGRVFNPFFSNFQGGKKQRTKNATNRSKNQPGGGGGAGWGGACKKGRRGAPACAGGVGSRGREGGGRGGKGKGAAEAPGQQASEVHEGASAARCVQKGKGWHM